MMDLEGKSAFVTGAGSGIGRASAVALARAGAKLMIVDIAAPGLEITAAKIRDIGGEAHIETVDVTDPGAVADMIATCVARFGRLDIAHNNAGVSGDPYEFGDMPLTDAERIVSVNFWGVFHCMQAEIRQMLGQGGGTIVNTASGAGIIATPTYSTYSASKHAVVGLTKSVAAEYASRGIRINSVCPGYVETPMTDPQRGSEETRRAIAAAHPIGRVAQPEEIAEAVVWLASRYSSFVVGANLMIDGGYSLA
jgi:NAD(P)-dependent dehydrogenase (short-subunit alcohol dehydrogenase family)